MPDMNAVTQLPACHNCHQRKIKCDSRRPKCNACEKNGIDCFILVNEEQISRQYIHALEEKERALRAEIIEELDSSNASRDHPTEPSFTESSHTPRSSVKPSNFVEGSGLSFLKSLFTDVEWRENNANLLQNLARTSPVAEATVQSNLLPSADDSRVLFQTYLEGSHIQNPFLLRQDILDLHGRVYSCEIVAPHDLFRTFMICAIGSVNLHRSGVHTKHPFGYYLAAMQHFDQEFLSKGVGAIQDLLLICRFAIYHHIGASIWDITQLCIRMCIEQELHRNPHMNMSLLQEQLRRRVFWECYMIDRYSSMTLDRPFAIADRDIEIGFPAEANDEEVVAASNIFPSLEAFCAMYSPVGTNEMSVFFHCVRLRQVTSKIHSEFSPLVLNDAAESQSQAILATGEVYTKLDRLLLELEEWRQAGPVVNRPRCLYERLEYYDLLHSRERLVLIRKAIDLVPKRNGLPPKDLLLLCLESATRTVLLYSDLFQHKHITYTRSYFQMLFTAGLSIMSCLSAVMDLAKTSAAEPMRALSVCEELLQFMGTQLPDARHYAIVFEALHRNVSQKRTNTQLTHKGSNSTNLPQTSLPNTSQAEGSHGNYLSRQGQQLHRANNVLANEGSIMQISNSNSNLYPASSDWLTMPQNGNTQNDLTHSGFQLEDASQWAFLNDGTLWDMEVGLSEYAYGNPGANANLFNGLDFDFS